MSDLPKCVQCGDPYDPRVNPVHFADGRCVRCHPYPSDAVWRGYYLPGDMFDDDGDAPTG